MSPRLPQAVKQFCIVILVVVVARLIFACALPLDVSGDEAYYWDWGREPSWGYYSKPPLIAWLMTVAGWAGHNTDIGLRVTAMVLGTLSLLAMYALSYRMWGSRVALLAILITIASPANVALNFILTIDAPLMVFWPLALLAFHLQVNDRPRRWLWALLTMACLGLGLLSKQIMIAFHVMMLIYLALSPGKKALLKAPDLWVAWLGSLAFLLPTVLWNASHEWITVAHTSHHFEGKPITPWLILLRALEFVGSQIALISPPTAIAAGILAYLGIRHWKSLEDRARFLVVFSVPGLIVVLLMLFRQKINANWPAVFYPTLLILLSAAIAGHEALPSAIRDRWKGWLKPILITGFSLLGVAMLMPFFLAATGLSGASGDPLVRLEGWKALAREVHKVRELHDCPPEQSFVITTGHRYTTSHLAFYLPDQPKVYRWPDQPGVIESQYEIWGLSRDLDGRDAIIVVPDEEPSLSPVLTACFDSVEVTAEIAVPIGARGLRHYTLYTGRRFNLSSAPPEVLQGAFGRKD